MNQIEVYKKLKKDLETELRLKAALLRFTQMEYNKVQKSYIEAACIVSNLKAKEQ